MSDDARVIQFAARADWRDWLERNHETASAVWLVTWTNATGELREVRTSAG